MSQNRVDDQLINDGMSNLAVGASIHRAVSAPITSPVLTDEADLDGADYVNAHDKSARWYLAARVFALRQGAYLGFGLQHLAAPGAPSTTEDFWLDSTIGSSRGKGVIKVDVWVPPTRQVRGKRPAVINFHGGGFVLGQGTDDTRWARYLMDSLDAVVFAVNYRLAPAYPFPKAVEDCVDAILQIVARAEEFDFDPSRLILSGFSAGGNLALASWIVLQQPEKWDYHLDLPVPKITAFSLFYPLLDCTTSRPRKRARCIRPDMTLPSSLTDIIDASYIYPPRPREECNDWRLSPGLMSDALVDKLPPVHLCLCEWDMLLPEQLTFAERLNTRKKHIVVRLVAEEKHAWDKPPPLQPKKSMGVEYGEAIKTLKECLEHIEEAHGQERPIATLIRANTGT